MADNKIKFSLRQRKVVLTEEQKREQADVMATRAQLLETIEAEKKSSNAYFKERLERVSGEIRTAARLYKDGYDWTDVECAIVKDWEFGEILYIRVDTCELAHVENMSQAERQHHIDEFLGAEKKDAVVDQKTGETVNTETGELQPGHNSGCGAGVGTGQDTGSNEEIKRKRKVAGIAESETTAL